MDETRGPARRKGETEADPRTQASTDSGSGWVVASGLLLLLLGLLQYSRIPHGSVRDLETRERIVRLLRSTPGMEPLCLTAATGLHHTTIRYHLRRLLASGVVSERRAGRRRFYFVVGDSSIDDATRLRMMRAPSARALFEAAARRPGIAVGEAYTASGVHRTTAHGHLRKLVDAGMLRIEGRGKGRRVYPRDS